MKMPRKRKSWTRQSYSWFFSPDSYVGRKVPGIVLFLHALHDLAHEHFRHVRREIYYELDPFRIFRIAVMQTKSIATKPCLVHVVSRADNVRCPRGWRVRPNWNLSFPPTFLQISIISFETIEVRNEFFRNPQKTFHRSGAFYQAECRAETRHFNSASFVCKFSRRYLPCTRIGTYCNLVTVPGCEQLSGPRFCKGLLLNELTRKIGLLDLKRWRNWLVSAAIGWESVQK